MVAVVAGVMSVALKGGMRQKATQSTDLLKKSGAQLGEDPDSEISSIMGVSKGSVLNATASDANFTVYEGDARHTQVTRQDSESIMKKGGAQTSSSNSESQTNTFNYEAYNAVHGGSN